MKINEITRDEWSLMSDEDRKEYLDKENVSAREKYAKHQKHAMTKKRKMPVIRSGQ